MAGPLAEQGPLNGDRIVKERERMAHQAGEYLKMAEQLGKSGDYGKAVALLREAVAAGVAGEHVYTALGRALRERGEAAEAVAAFAKALDGYRARGDAHGENILRNEIEIAQKKTLLASNFRALGVVLTTACNLRCIMCNSCGMPWELPERTAREIADAIPFLQRVMWLGGEVFLSKSFEPLFDAAALNPRLHQTVVTNGLLIDEKWADKLARAHLNLTYSIDGVTKKTYEYVRRGARFEDLRASARLIRRKKEEYRAAMSGERRMTLSMNYVVMKSTCGEIADAAEFAKEHGFDDLTLTPVDYMDGDENIFRNRDVAALRAAAEAAASAGERAREYGMTFHNWLPAEGTTEDAGRPACAAPVSAKDQGLFCYWPWQHLFIDVGGAVKPHCLCHGKVGTVQENTLREIWNSPGMQSYRGRIIEGSYRATCNAVCVSSAIARECMGILW